MDQEKQQEALEDLSSQLKPLLGDSGMMDSNLVGSFVPRWLKWTWAMDKFCGDGLFFGAMLYWCFLDTCYHRYWCDYATIVDDVFHYFMLVFMIFLCILWYLVSFWHQDRCLALFWGSLTIACDYFQESLAAYPIITKIIALIIILVTNLFLSCQRGPSGGGAGSSARLGGHR